MPLRSTMFEGEDAEARNALMSALMDCVGDDGKLRPNLTKPEVVKGYQEAGFIVELHAALLKSGYKITKI